MDTHVARPSRSSTPERVRLSSACTTFTDLGFSRSRSEAWAGTGPAWRARSTSAVASTLRCPLDSWGQEEGASVLPQSPRDPRLQPAPATHILNNKRPLFGLILVHVWVLGKGGTGEYRGCCGGDRAGRRACAGSGGDCVGPSHMLSPPGRYAPRLLLIPALFMWWLNATSSKETSWATHTE